MNINLPLRGLKFAHLNICSLRNKIIELSSILLENKIHVVGISETHLDESFEDSTVNIQGYNVYRMDRDKNGGGVALYVQEHIPAKVRQDLSMSGVEALWLQLHFPHAKPLLICCCYRPPNAASEYLNSVCLMFQQAVDTNNDVFIVGDMNVDWLATHCHMKKKLSDAAVICNLKQIIHVPTRVKVNRDGSVTSTCIDHIYMNTSAKCVKVVSEPVGFSDHNVIAVVLERKNTKQGKTIIYRRMYKRFCEESFKSDLDLVKWDVILKEVDVEKALDTFMSLLSPICDKHAPLKKTCVRATKAPWLDEELRNLMKQRDELKKRAIVAKSPKDWQNYKSLRNLVTKLNRHKKKQYYQTKFEEHKNDGKKLWRTINDILRKKKSGSVPAFVEVGGEFLTKPRMIANHFNDFYLEKIKNITSLMPLPTSNMSVSIIKEQIMSKKNCCFEFVPITIKQMEELLLSIQYDSSVGADHLDGRLLQLSTKYIIRPICHIFNLCLQKHVFPNLWKTAKVVPLVKNSRDQLSAQNSRPISILPILSKLLENNMFKQIQNYFMSNGLHSDFQHAYKPGFSTATALATLSDEWLKQIDQQNLNGVVFIDFSAAFDVIDHKLLIDKLCTYGFKRSAVNLIESYLTNRQQFVLFNGCQSDTKRLSHGIPQGSCLGPLMYSIFVNEISFVLEKAQIISYADDVTLHVSAKTSSELNTILQQEINLIFDWANENRLKINVLKTKCMVIGSKIKIKSNHSLSLSMHGTKIEQVSEIKLLGVTIDSSLSWTPQIKNTVAKMSRAISNLKRCVYFLDSSITKLVIQSLVLSHFDYCSVIWSSASKTDLSKLQIIQNRAARLALRCPFRTSVSAMHERLAWFKVEDRMTCSLILFCKNVFISHKPLSLFSQLQLTSDRHSFQTRQASKGQFTIPLPNSNALRRTVMYRAVIEWNKLPSSLIAQAHKTCFKRILKKHLKSQCFK